MTVLPLSAAGDAIVKNNIYVHVSGHLNNQSELSKVLDGTNVAVGVWGDGSYDLQSLANNLLNEVQKDGYNVVIVGKSNGSGSEFNVASTDSNVAENVQNTLNTFSSISVSRALEFAAPTVVEKSSGITSTTQSVNVDTRIPDSSTFEVFANFGSVVLGLALAVAIYGIVFDVFFGRKRRIKKKQKKLQKEAEKRKLLELEHTKNIFPENIQNELARLDDLREKHKNIGSYTTSIKIDSIIKNLTKLFEQFQKNSFSESQLNIASLKYENILQKLILTIDEDHYMDAYVNPAVWSDASTIIRQVDENLDAVNEQIVNNIRQLNDSKQLDFKVATKMLTDSSNNDNTIENIYGFGKSNVEPSMERLKDKND